MAAEPSGFALRTLDECVAGEVNCGDTRQGYHVCCPNGSWCPTQYNVDCCPQENVNCTSSLVKKPACANETWDLFDNNGYFCCLHGLKGYASTEDSDGCAEPDYEFQQGEVTLPLLKAGTVPTPTTAQTSTVQTSTAHTTSSNKPTSEPTATPTPSNKPTSSNTGAIAGGVVGGVAALVLVAVGIWWLLRRKRDVRNVSEVDADGQKINELPGTSPPAELPTSHTAPSELPG